jgi:tripartite-type tricarboxylate transporter receptor subunit TctC
MKKKLYAFLTAFVMSFATINYAWSTETIELIVPTPPGGAIDTTARAISKAMTAQGINNVVVHQPGAGGEIAIANVLKKQNNVIFVASSANFVFLDVSTNQKVQVTNNMQLFGPSVLNAMGFVVAPGNQFKTFKELITVAKAEEVPCGVSNTHGEILLNRMNKEYGTKFTPVMYKGTGQMLPNVIGGQLKCAYDQTGPYTSQGDKVRWLATSAANPIRPGVPTIGSVLPGFKFETWYAAAVPNNSNLLKNSAVIDILRFWQNDRDVVQPLLTQGFTISPTQINLNRIATNETDSYLKLLNSKK